MVEESVKRAFRVCSYVTDHEGTVPFVREVLSTEGKSVSHRSGIIWQKRVDCIAMFFWSRCAEKSRSQSWSLWCDQ